MIEIIKRAHDERVVEYRLEFERRTKRFPDEGWSGFSFDCDENGLVEPDREAQVFELKGNPDFFPPVVQKIERWVRHGAVGRCGCGAEVGLGGFTNTCRECGADYNSSGCRLAPRSQWGEETGETADEILQAEAAGFPEEE